MKHKFIAARSSTFEACPIADVLTHGIPLSIAMRFGELRMMRLLAYFAIVFVSTGAAAQSPSAATGDFCARLAADNGIDRAPTPAGPTSWTVNAMNFGQRFLVGGSAATGVGVSPLEPATVEDYRRLDTMCLPEGKGAVCKLVGPVNFKFTWKGRRTITPMALGERATISVAGTKTTCRSEARQ